jgi:uncharacterized protein (DUF305 family)
MRLSKRLGALILCAALALLPSVPMAMAQTMSPASKGYMDAMAKMQKDMPQEPSGDPDVDFARYMIPHHQAAIDMAKVHLQHGKDAKLKRMSEKVIKAQEKEIKELQAWLKVHSK